MKKQIIADVNPHEVRVALLEDDELAEIQVELRGHERLVGNIYKGRVANILPGMQAAFIDVGLERNAFLYAGDIRFDKSEFEFEGEQTTENSNFEVPLIQDMLKKGQEIMVQVLKQPGGTKGARVTTHVTLPGRMLVLMPTVDHIGVSRRITDEAERERLKEIFTRIKPEGMGVIVRTVAEGMSEEEFITELKFLTRLWSRVQKKANMLNAPRLIHAEETLLFRVVRDLFNSDVDKFVINDYEFYQKVLAMVKITQPELIDRVKYFDSAENIFDRYAIESMVDKAVQRKIWLKSGAYLVIDEAEALTAIDVNTGKYIGEYDLQETIFNTNLEAAKEISRQLRLRDIGGIIIIDFIDMDDPENRKRLLDNFCEYLKNDRTKTNVLGMTELGLVEMTRKKVRRKLSTIIETTCPYCSGTGKVYSNPTMMMRLRREIIRVVNNSDAKAFMVELAPSVADYVMQMNANNEALLPEFEGRHFYITENKLAHIHSIKVTSMVDYRRSDDKNNNGHHHIEAQSFF